MKRLFTLALIVIVGILLLRSAGLWGEDETTPTETPQDQTEVTVDTNTDTDTDINNEANETEDDQTDAVDTSETTPEETDTPDQTQETPVDTTPEVTTTTETTTTTTTAPSETSPTEAPEDEAEKVTTTEETEIDEAIEPLVEEVAEPRIYIDQYDFYAVNEVKVFMYEWDINLLNSTNLKPGMTKFIVQNNGSRSHEFNIKGLYNFGRIAPNETRVFGINLEAGTVEIYSSLSIDQTQGMVAPMTVSE